MFRKLLPIVCGCCLLTACNHTALNSPTADWSKPPVPPVYTDAQQAILMKALKGKTLAYVSHIPAKLHIPAESAQAMGIDADRLKLTEKLMPDPHKTFSPSMAKYIAHFYLMNEKLTTNTTLAPTAPMAVDKPLAMSTEETIKILPNADYAIDIYVQNWEILPSLKTRQSLVVSMIDLKSKKPIVNKRMTMDLPLPNVDYQRIYWEEPYASKLYELFTHMINHYLLLNMPEIITASQ